MWYDTRGYKVGLPIATSTDNISSCLSSGVSYLPQGILRCISTGTILPFSVDTPLINLDTRFGVLAFHFAEK